MTGHHKQMPQVGKLTRFIVGALLVVRDHGPMKAAVTTVLRT
jgi:hypothetical protein